MRQINETSQEKISALLDDELDSSEQDHVLDMISGAPALADTWQRYHLIRAVVRKEAIVHISDLPDRVAPALGSNVEPLRRPESRSRSASRWLPGLAIAASVAGLISVGLFAFLPGTDIRDSANPIRVADVKQGTKWDAVSPDHEHALNAFLVEHGEFTPMPNMNGLMAYAKFVSYNSDH